MTWKWSYFAGAAILTAYFLLSHGVPAAPVIAGLAGAAMFMRRARRAH
jgi:hypothetical protein